jgi:cytochrome P450
MSAYTLGRYRLRYPGEAFVALQQGRLQAYERLASVGADICYVKAGPYRVHFLTHPDLVSELVTEKEDAFWKGNVLQQAGFLFGQGLLTSEGDTHRRHRRLVTHAFHHGRIREYASEMVAITRQHTDQWQQGDALAVENEMASLTLEVVAKTLFGTSAGGRHSDLSATFAETLRILSRKTNPLMHGIAVATGVDAYQRRRATARLDAFTERLIRDRRSSTHQGNDLLQMLLESRDTSGHPAFDDREIRDEVITMLASGHETTSVALTWAWYLLDHHPGVRDRLHAEVDDVLQGRPPEFEDLERLPFTRRVISETLRLYAPLWAFARQAKRTVEIGGHPVGRGDYVLVSPLLIHRNGRYWPDPDRFDPDRFLPENRTSRPRFAYFPFSAGPRGCIGEQFAWTESVLVIAAIAQRWTLRRSSCEEIPPAAGLLTLRPKGPVVMLPEPRRTPSQAS